MNKLSLRDKLFQIPARVKALRNDCRSQNKGYFPSMFTASFDLSRDQIDALHHIAANFLQMDALLTRARLLVQDEEEELESPPPSPPRSLKKINSQLDAIEEDVYEIAVLLRARAIQQQRRNLRWSKASRRGMQIKMAVSKALSFTTTEELRIVKSKYDRTLLWLAAVRKLEFEPAARPAAVNSSYQQQLQVRPSLHDAHQRVRGQEEELIYAYTYDATASRAANSLFLVRDRDYDTSHFRKTRHGYSDLDFDYDLESATTTHKKRKAWSSSHDIEHRKARRLWTDEDELEVHAYAYNYEDLTQRCTTANLDSRKDDDTLSLIPDSRRSRYTLHSVDSWGPARYQYGNKNEW